MKWTVWSTCVGKLTLCWPRSPLHFLRSWKSGKLVFSICLWCWKSWKLEVHNITCNPRNSHICFLNFPCDPRDRSEGLPPNGIFGPWAWWSRALARWESCWDVAAAAVAAATVTGKLGSETVLVFGPESVSYERSRLIDRCILREISARVFFVKIQKYRNNSDFQYFQNIGKLEKSNFQYFQDRTESKKSVFQYLQDYR